MGVCYLLWDFDGTLAERPGMWSQCLADVTNDFMGTSQFQRESFVPYLAAGFPWHMPEVGHPELSDSVAWWSALEPTLSEAICKGANLPKALADQLLGRVRLDYINPIRWQVFPDTVGTLEELSAKGWRHIVLSNHVPELPTLANALGIGQHFDQIYTSALLGYEKPNPLCFQAVLAHLPRRAKIIMIGDNYAADVLGAQAAGLKAVLVRKPHPSTNITQSFHSLAACLGESSPENPSK